MADCSKKFSSDFLRKLWRKKTLEADMSQTALKRCLSMFDLTILGIASTLGGGIYVLVGVVAHSVTGPALVLSILVAGFANFLTALCFAEFGCRIPKTGASYIFTYITLGELAAFLIGWNLLLEHILSAAIAARGVVINTNAIGNQFIAKATTDFFLKMDWDPYAVVIVVAVTIMTCIGLRQTAIVNNTLTSANLLTLIFFVVMGFFLGDWSNWSNNFLPYGFSSVFVGASRVYFFFTGYDVVTVASEEAKNPARSVPVALITTILFVTGLMSLIAVSLTIMVPYLDISETNALSAAFDYNGLHWAANTVSVGAILSLSCVVISDIMCISRMTYAIASEGLLFRFLSRVNTRTQVPIIATICGAMIVIPTAFFVPLEDLADMVAFGNLLAYAFVAFAVIKLRTTILEFPKHDGSTDLCDEASSLLGNGNENYSPKTIFHEISKSNKNQINLEWNQKQFISATLFLLCAFLACIALTIAQNATIDKFVEFWACIISFACFLCIAGFCLAFFWSDSSITDYGDDNGYRVPLVPVLPAFSVFVNFYLMTQLSLVTWARSAIWVTCGLLIYFFYGAKNSSLEEKDMDDSRIECE